MYSQMKAFVYHYYQNYHKYLYDQREWERINFCSGMRRNEARLAILWWIASLIRFSLLRHHQAMDMKQGNNGNGNSANCAATAAAMLAANGYSGEWLALITRANSLISILILNSFSVPATLRRSDLYQSAAATSGRRRGSRNTRTAFSEVSIRFSFAPKWS